MRTVSYAPDVVRYDRRRWQDPSRPRTPSAHGTRPRTDRLATSTSPREPSARRNGTGACDSIAGSRRTTMSDVGGRTRPTENLRCHAGICVRHVHADRPASACAPRIVRSSDEATHGRDTGSSTPMAMRMRVRIAPPLRSGSQAFAGSLASSAPSAWTDNGNARRGPTGRLSIGHGMSAYLSGADGSTGWSCAHGIGHPPARANPSPRPASSDARAMEGPTELLRQDQPHAHACAKADDPTTHARACRYRHRLSFRTRKNADGGKAYGGGTRSASPLTHPYWGRNVRRAREPHDGTNDPVMEGTDT